MSQTRSVFLPVVAVVSAYHIIDMKDKNEAIIRAMLADIHVYERVERLSSAI